MPKPLIYYIALKTPVCITKTSMFFQLMGFCRTEKLDYSTIMLTNQIGNGNMYDLANPHNFTRDRKYLFAQWSPQTMASTTRRGAGDEPPPKRQDTGRKKGTSRRAVAPRVSV